MKNIEHYIPKVYYENLNKTYLKNIDTFIEENKDKKLVLICNGNVLSRQSQNFDFNPILTHLSSKYKNCLFIYTANLIVPKESNLIITNSIIKKEGVDLNEISYLSLKCDIIIGRESGPFCYTRVKENYLNDKKTYICFCNNKNEGLWHKSDYAKQIWCKNYVLGMYRIINHDVPDDFILSTNETHSIKEFIDEACKYTCIDIVWYGEGVKEKGVDKNTNKTIIEIDEKYYRPAEVDILIGDNTKAKKVLNWPPTVKFLELVKIMMEYDKKNV